MAKENYGGVGNLSTDINSGNDFMYKFRCRPNFSLLIYP